MRRVGRPAGAAADSIVAPPVRSGAALPRSRRCRSAVASARRPARVRRVASSMLSGCGKSFMSKVQSFLAGKQLERPREEAQPVSRCMSPARADGAGLTPGSRRRGPSDEGPHTILSARAALTTALAWSAPSTLTEAIAARASSGVTSMAMLASPSTWMWSVSPAARTVSRSSRV